RSAAPSDVHNRHMDALAPLPAMTAPQAPAVSSLPDIPPPVPLPAMTAVPPFPAAADGLPPPGPAAAPFMPAAPMAAPYPVTASSGPSFPAPVPAFTAPVPVSAQPGIGGMPGATGLADASYVTSASDVVNAPGGMNAANVPGMSGATTPTASPSALPFDVIDRPVARIDAPTVTTMDSVVMLDGRGSVGLGSGRLEFLWRQIGGPFVSEFERVFNGAAERFAAPEPGVYEFELVVVDSGIESAPALHRITVNPGAEPPVAVVLAPERAIPGAIVRMDATRSYDPKGNPLIYRWRQTGGPAVKDYIIEEHVGDAAPAFRPEAEGIYSFELIVSNGKLNSRSVEIDIFVGNAALPPLVTMQGPEAVAAGEAATYRVMVENAPNRRFTFEWRQLDGPPGALRQADGIQATVVPPRPGRYVFDVVAFENGREAGSARRVLEVFRPTNGRGTGPRFVEPLPEYAEVRGRASPRGAGRVPDIQPLPNSAPLPDLPAASGGNRVVGSNRGLPAAQVLQGGATPPGPIRR
ncbi:MAG: hypothetical protein LUG50_13885, partial [Planctomycetaceae bacterium]|nr:hypothetical protein [Planctomycetaceae bacterium]